LRANRHYALVGEDDLSAAMAQAAARFAEGDARLDFSMTSLDALAQSLTAEVAADAGRGRECAAYLGEVLLRAAPGGRWVKAPPRMVERPGDPGLRWGRWFADPAERIRHYAGEHDPEDTLSSYASQVVTYARNPTEETAARLGWSTRHSTQMDELRHDLRRLWRRVRRRS
jgi:hypothetical protein